MFKTREGGSKAVWTMLKKTALLAHDGFPKLSRQVLLTSKKYTQGGSRRGGNADSRSRIFGGKGPGSPRLGAVNLRFCYHQMSFPEASRAGFPCRQLTAVTEQKYSSENSKLPQRSEIVVCLHFFLNQAPLYLSVLISFCWKKKTICNLLIIALARKVSKSLSQRLKT